VTQDRALRSLREICQLLERKGALAKGRALDVTRALDATELPQQKKLREPAGWTIIIADPLELTCSEPRTKHLRVDISGRCPAPSNGSPGENHSVTIRVWSTDEAEWCDAGRDHPKLVAAIRARNRGRVMLRVHFDREVAGGGGPWAHLQVGGTADNDEYYPYPPPGFDFPRFPHHPVDFVLALEFVTRTFCPGVYEQVYDQACWTDAISQSQREFTSAYYRKLKKHLVSRPNSSLLECCWTRPS